MKLNIQERLAILGMQEIPRFGNLVTMRLTNDLFTRVGFTEKEITDWQIAFEPREDGKTFVRWNPEKIEGVEIDLTPGMLKILTGAIERADSLPINIVALYDRMKDAIPLKEPEKIEITAQRKRTDEGDNQ